MASYLLTAFCCMALICVRMYSRQQEYLRNRLIMTTATSVDLHSQEWLQINTLKNVSSFIWRLIYEFRCNFCINFIVRRLIVRHDVCYMLLLGNLTVVSLKAVDFYSDKVKHNQIGPFHFLFTEINKFVFAYVQTIQLSWAKEEFSF